MSGVEYTVRKVSEEALEEMQKALTVSGEQANKVVSDRALAAKEEVQKIDEHRIREADALKRQIIGAAEMSSRNRSLEVVEQNLSSAFEKANTKLEAFTKTQEYDQVLRSLVSQGIEQIGGGDCILAGNERDQKALKKIVEQISKEGKSKVSLDPKPIKKIGGVVVRSSDGYVRFDNTFEARLERLKPSLRKQIAQLFSGK
ncbi:MAG: V-type ATP synthase subunit E [Nitrososphaerales archaeon]